MFSYDGVMVVTETEKEEYQTILFRILQSDKTVEKKVPQHDK